MTSPLVLLIGPLVGAAALFGVRRWPRVSAMMGILFALGMWIWTATVSLEPAGPGLAPARTAFVLGRTLTLDAQLRLLMLFVYGLLTLLFLASLWMPQGRDYAALALAVISPLTAALMVAPFVFGAAFLALAAAVLSLLIQSEQAGSALAGLRWLTISLLASTLLLIAGWLLEREPPTASPVVALLFAIAFLILLVGFPFHIWVAPAFRRAASLVPPVIFGLVQMMVLVFCLRLLQDNPGVQGSRLFFQLATFAGLVTILAGGALSLVSRSMQIVPGYLMLISTGSVLLSLGFSDALGQQAALALVMSRILGLLLVGLGAENLQMAAPAGPVMADEWTDASGLAYRSPLGVAVYTFGALTLVGLPMTPGFAGQYAVLLLANSVSPWLGVAVVLSLASGAFTLLRLMVRLLQRPPEAVRAGGSEARAPLVIGGLVLAVALLLALLPTLLMTYAFRLAQLF